MFAPSFSRNAVGVRERNDMENIKMKIRKFGPFRAVGLIARTSHADESNDDTAIVSKMRGWFLEHYLGGLICHRLDRCEFFEVYTDYETDHLGEFTFMIGHRVWEICDVDDDMMAIEVPRRRYAVFKVNMDKDFPYYETELEIIRYFNENSNYRRAYTTDLIISNGVEGRYYVSIQ
jgi:predicted transcriptional regulator YdeE